MTELLRRTGPLVGWLALLTTVIWVAFMIVLPTILMVDYSFRPNLPPARIGSPEDVYTLRNYLTLWDNTIHRGIFFKTIWSSVLVTLLALTVCYPIAYHLAQVARGRMAALLIVALVVPFWVNEILRTFAWFLILARGGILNQALEAIGLVAAPIRFTDGNSGVMIGMVYAYILFMVFPIYNAIDSLDRNQIEAARDLGAPAWRIHWRVVIPHAKPGIAVGCIMTFMLSAGTIAVPRLLGGPRSRWFTEVIYSWFFDGGDWNQGAAYAFALLLLCILFIFLMMRLFRVRLQDVAR